jgi:hypothetical protein
MNEIKCKNCGLCCYYELNNKFKPCKHLKGNLGDTYCAVYENRLFRKIDNKVLCYPRKLSKFDYPDCPYNCNKPISKKHQELFDELKTDNA